MGKNRAIEELGNLIGNTVAHKMLKDKTNKPLSIGFLEAEEVEYRAQAREKSESYNWNASDIQIIKEKSLKKIKSKFDRQYTDITFSEEEAEKLINEEINSLLDPQ